MSDFRLVKQGTVRGDELKTLREAAGLRSGEVANLIGASRHKVVGLELGEWALESDEEWRRLFKTIREAASRGR